MAIYKCTMFINWSSGKDVDNLPEDAVGWSESVYDVTTDIPRMRREFLDLCQARAGLLSKKCAVVAQRYQQVLPTAPSALTRVVVPTALTLIQDVPGMSLIFRVPTVNGNHVREIALRGTPDARVSGGAYSGSRAYDDALRAYFNQLQGWAMLVQNEAAPKYPIVSITVGGIVAFAASTPLEAGKLYQFKRVRNTFGQNVGGEFQVTGQVTDDRHWQLAGWDGNEVDKSGYVTIPDIITRNLSLLADITPTVKTRKVGRPFGQSRGRASKRR